MKLNLIGYSAEVLVQAYRIAVFKTETSYPANAGGFIKMLSAIAADEPQAVALWRAVENQHIIMQVTK